MKTTDLTLKGCVEIYPVNVTKQMNDKERHVAIISLVSASLSLIGSMSTLGFIIWRKLVKVKTILPLFHLSVADFILALFWILTTSKSFVTKYDDPAFTALSCFIWQLLTEITHLATIFLTINYAIDVYFKMRDKTIKVHAVIEGNEVVESTTQKRFKKLLYVISWCLPLVIMMPIIVNIRADRISACQKCVIFIDVAVLTGVPSVPWDYGFMALAVTLTVSILLLVLLYFLSLKLYWKAVPGFRTDYQRKQLYNMQLRVTVYVLVFVTCWTPGLLISYHKWLKHAGSRAKGFLDIERLQVVYLLQASFAPLQGFLNSLVYGWSKKTFRRSPNPTLHVIPQHGNFVSPYYDYASSAFADDETMIDRDDSKRNSGRPLGY